MLLLLLFLVSSSLGWLTINNGMVVRRGSPLLSSHVNPSQWDGTVLQAALTALSYETVSQLVEAGALADLLDPIVSCLLDVVDHHRNDHHFHNNCIRFG